MGIVRAFIHLVTFLTSMLMVGLVAHVLTGSETTATLVAILWGVISVMADVLPVGD